jgi:hypothetical protein
MAQGTGTLLEAIHRVPKLEQLTSDEKKLLANMPFFEYSHYRTEERAKEVLEWLKMDCEWNALGDWNILNMQHLFNRRAESCAKLARRPNRLVVS